MHVCITQHCYVFTYSFGASDPFDIKPLICYGSKIAIILPIISIATLLRNQYYCLILLNLFYLRIIVRNFIIGFYGLITKNLNILINNAFNIVYRPKYLKMTL